MTQTDYRTANLRTPRGSQATAMAVDPPPDTNDEQWEDLSASEDNQHASGSIPSSPGPANSPRKRKTGKAAGTRLKSRTAAAAAKPPKPPRNLISADEVVDGLAETGKHVLRFAADVAATVAQYARKPIALIVLLWLLTVVAARVANTLRGAFAPLCVLPGIASSALCVPPAPRARDGAPGAPRWADYPALVASQSKSFEQLLDESVGGSGLALEIKKAEMATSDLATLVRVSRLTSRDMLAAHLVEFVGEAKRTGRGLQKLSAKVGGAVDGILAVNDYALHSIEAAYASAPAWYSPRQLLPGAASKTDEVVTRTFTESMDVLSASMQRLILEAEVSLTNLNKLEERLSTLHELVAREDSSLSSAKSELLSELWTKLGGNKHMLRGLDDHLELLKNLGDYRKRALVHVVAALQTLRGMSDDMEDLRERVAAPELAGSTIPVEVHMKSIRSGLERLKEGRIKAKEREEAAVRNILTVTSE